MFEPGTAENSAMSIARPLADVLGTSDLQLVRRGPRLVDARYVLGLRVEEEGRIAFRLLV